MSVDGIDTSRRRFLTTTASVVGGAGAAATTIPFISTLSPSAKTKAIGAPIEVEIGDLQPGERKIVQWQGKPVWILRRDEASLSGIKSLDGEVRDPGYRKRHAPQPRRSQPD